MPKTGYTGDVGEHVGRELGAWLVGYRLRHDLTQLELGQKLGWDQATVARLENGQRQPTLGILAYLATVLNVEVSLTFWKDGLDVRLTPDIQTFRRIIDRRAARVAATHRGPIRRGPQSKPF